MPDPIMSNTVNGPFMFVHEITGTYLLTDNYNDNIGQSIQTWNLDPVNTVKGQLGHLWYIEPVSSASDTCLIKSFENGRTLAAGIHAKDHPRLQEPKGTDKEQWIIRKVHGSEQVAHDADCYALIPKIYPDYALGLRHNVVSNDVYVLPTSMWGGPPSLSQYWKPVLQREQQKASGDIA
ncbi:hypothetical protein [Streptomyces sp. NPDC050704]|uniref:hypothetical protein n=1 Tax=Streptomyces sp. NPDC050704 TaxID=3157219 RepID=UPI0034485DD8